MIFINNILIIVIYSLMRFCKFNKNYSMKMLSFVNFCIDIRKDWLKIEGIVFFTLKSEYFYE